MAAGATLDLNGQRGYSAYTLALAGGTLKNSVEVGYDGYGMLGDIYLFADSSFVFDDDTFIGYSSDSAILDLGGNTLNVSMVKETKLRLYNTIVNNGTVIAGDRGTFIVGGNSIGVIATNSNFSICAGLYVDKPFKVNDYESRWTLADGNNGSATMSVYGVFKPTTDYFYGCRLMDGATLDLSARETVLDAQSLCTGGNRVISFEENATIRFSLGSRIFTVGSQVVSWTSKTKPENVDTVKFVCVDEGRKCKLRVKDDGLYYSGCGLVISVL